MNTSDFSGTQERTHESAGRRGGSRKNDFDPGAAKRLRLDRLLDIGRNLGAQLDEQVHKRPYAVLGAAVGVGFAAGSVLGSRLGQVLIAAGLGYVGKHFLGPDFGIERIQATLERMAAEAERRATPS
jgi:hypothetical protein